MTLEYSVRHDIYHVLQDEIINCFINCTELSVRCSVGESVHLYVRDAVSAFVFSSISQKINEQRYDT
jgi:hypothetical protein